MITFRLHGCMATSRSVVESHACRLESAWTCRRLASTVCRSMGKDFFQSRRDILAASLAWTLLKPAIGKADETPGPSELAHVLSGASVSREGASSSALLPELQPTMPTSDAGAGAIPAPPAAPEAPPPSEAAPQLKSLELNDEAVKKLLKEAEDDRRKSLRRRKKGRIHELEEIRGELAEKEIILLQKEQELLDKEQDVLVLTEELDLERKLRALLSKEKERAEEEAALAMGLCTGGAMLP